MNFLDIDSIKIEAQQRKAFDPNAQKDLEDSIKNFGLIAQILVVELTEITEGFKYSLVAGERRLKAFTNLYKLDNSIGVETGLKIAGTPIPQNTIPAIVISAKTIKNYSEEELKAYLYRLQYEENTNRKDLAITERAIAMAELARLELAAKKREVAALPDPKLTTLSPPRPPTTLSSDIVKTVAEKSLGGSKGGNFTNTKILIAAGEALQSDKTPPEVKKTLAAATSVAALEKTLKIADTRAAYAKKAEDVSTTFHDNYKAINGDCLVELDKFKDGEFFGAITDPIYGVGADKFGNSDKRANPQLHNFDDSYETWKKVIPRMLEKLDRVVSKDGVMFIFCDINRFHELKSFINSSWTVYNFPVIIYQTSLGMRVTHPNKSPRRQYQVAIMAWRGGFLRQAELGDVIETPKSDKEIFGSNKPVELLEKVIRALIPVGAKIIDPMAGTGSILDAAKNCGVGATVIEVQKEQFGRILERLGK